MSMSDNSLNLDESVCPPGSAHSPVTLISNDFLPPGVGRGQVIQYQTPMVVETPTLHHDSSEYLHDAVEGIIQMKSALEARFNNIEDKLEHIANNQRALSDSRSLPRDDITGSVATRVGEKDSPDPPGILSPNLICISPDQLNRLVEEKVTAKLMEMQQMFLSQSLAEVRIRSLENSLDIINRSITNLSAQSGSFPMNQVTIRPNPVQTVIEPPEYTTFQPHAAKPSLISLDMSMQNSTNRGAPTQALYDTTDHGHLSSISYTASHSNAAHYPTTESAMRRSYIPNSIIQTPIHAPSVLSQDSGRIKGVIDNIRRQAGLQISQ